MVYHTHTIPLKLLVVSLALHTWNIIYSVHIGDVVFLGL